MSRFLFGSLIVLLVVMVCGLIGFTFMATYVEGNDQWGELSVWALAVAGALLFCISFADD